MARGADDLDRVAGVRATQRHPRVAVPIVLLGSLLFMPVLGTTGVELMWLLIAPVQILMNRFVHARTSEQSSA